MGALSGRLGLNPCMVLGAKEGEMDSYSTASNTHPIYNSGAPGSASSKGQGLNLELNKGPFCPL